MNPRLRRVAQLAIFALAIAACSDPSSSSTSGSAGSGASNAGASGSGNAAGSSAGGTAGAPSGGAGASSGSGGSSGSSNGGATSSGGTTSSGAWEPEFETLTLSSDFYAEGSAVGDIDQDGVLDLVAGPHWYAGPDFGSRGEIEDAPPIDVVDYSRHFLSFVDDLDHDGDLDVISIGEGGTDARWYENPGRDGLGTPWPEHIMFASGVGNESPAYVDLVGDDDEELVFMMNGYLGYGVPGESPSAPWTFRAISDNEGFSHFTHGLGVGDVNGDGVPDVLERDGWWEQIPGGPGEEPTWEHHPADFRQGGRGGAQMYAFDVDGDGDNDVVATRDGHGYGLYWFENVTTDSGITFTPHQILPAGAGNNNVSQLHALGVGDLNGDGLVDLVTGKRYYAHAPPTDPGGTDPALIDWFELRRGPDGVSFVRHALHDASGVGCQVTVHDVNGDGKLDVLVSNKLGTFLHRQR